MDRFYAQSYEGVQSFMNKVFGWMAGALAITGMMAYYIGTRADLVIPLMKNQWAFIGLLVAELAVVMVLSMALHKISYPVAFVLFMGYSLLNGVTLSSIFVAYTPGSIATTFFVAAGMFLFMAAWGWLTKADLTSMGNLMMMMLWGIILAMVINIFVQSTMFELIVSIIAVIIFAGLTAYDVQKMKELAMRVDNESEEGNKLSLIGALMLYLDFVNLFLNLLSIMGNRRD